MVENACPSCGHPGLETFYEVSSVPVNSVMNMRTRAQALAYPRGDLRLGFCRACGFVSNQAFDPTLTKYCSECEESQGYSPTFNTFQRRLAQGIIDRHNLRNKRIVEIGCGKGDFLALLCELGNNQGVGLDPAYVPGRFESSAADRLEFITDFYSPKYASYRGDLVACKMTLEHIPDTAALVSNVRASLENSPDSLVFFQVPSTRRVLKDLAFWDVYYEHCSYFTAGSLARLFRHCGFDVQTLGQDYDDQYLMIEARPGSGAGAALEGEDDLAEVAEDIRRFAEGVPAEVESWKREIRSARRPVLWGSGSKGVAFLTTTGIRDEVEYVVDINPHRQGTFMAGTGHAIVAPEFLRDYRPDLVVAMNPVYREEIQRDLNRLGLAPVVKAAGESRETARAA